jgi:hypothetical protein
VAGMMPVKKSFGKENNLGKEKELVIVSSPSGILPARSKLRTKVTFQPFDHGEYEFTMLCRVARVDARTGAPVMLSPDELSLAAGNLQALASAAQGGVEAYKRQLPLAEQQQAKGKDSSSSSYSSSSILPMQLSLVGKATFPTLVMRDVRVEGGGEGMGCSPSHIFEQLNLKVLNESLCTPLTKDQVEFNVQSSPDLSILPKYDFNFTPMTLGSKSQVIFIELRNPAFLPVKFSVHLPNEKSIEMETWADEGEPTASQIKSNRVIDELKCFEISPKSGELASGESILLRLSYSYHTLEYEGEHELPLLFKVFQGKQFWLKAKGKTLSLTEPHLHLPRSCVLDPVAVGTKVTDAPLQLTEIMNTSNVDLTYKVDQHSITKFCKEHCFDSSSSLKVLQIENPHGLIPPRSSTFLRWRFLPLEAREYSVSVGIKGHCHTNSREGEGEEGGGGGEKKVQGTLQMKCRGFDIRKEDPHR